MKMITKFLYLTLVFMSLSAIVAGQSATDNVNTYAQYADQNLTTVLTPEIAPAVASLQGEPGDFEPGSNPFVSQMEQNGTGGTEDLKIWVLPTNGATSGLSRAPSNFYKYQRTKYLITPADMAASGFPAGSVVSSIGFFISSAGVGTLTGTLKVWLQNTADVTYLQGNTWNTTGYTQVHDNPSFTVPISPAGLMYDETFIGGSPFTYTGGGVYVAWEFESPAGTPGTTAVVHNCNNTLVGGLAGYRGATQSTTLAASNWRPATRFGTTSFDDIVEVTHIYTLEKVPTPFGTPTPVGVRVVNITASPVVFDLTLEVRETGFSVLRHTETQAGINLGANSSLVIDFTGWNPTLQENVNIKAFTSAIPGETWTINNTLTIPGTVNDDLYSYFYPYTPGSGYGFTAPGDGIFSAKYTMNGVGTISGANIFLYNFAANVGNTIYAVLLNSAGTIVSQTANYVIQASDLGTLKTFNFPSPTSFNNEDFYVGLAQTYLTGTAQYYPLGIIAENPQRGNTYYNFDITGGAPGVSTATWKYMIEAIVGAGVNNDVATLSIDMGEVLNQGNFAPQATVINNGIVTQTFDVEMTIAPGGYSSTQTVVSLPPGGTQQVTFDPWSNTIGDYTVTVCTQLAGDVVPANDCKSQSVKVLDLNKNVFGYNAFTGSGSDPEGPITFNMATPGNLTSIADQSALNFISGGTWANGIWYGTVYNTAAPYNLVTIDPGTGARTIVGDMGVNMNGLSYNPANGMMYGVGYDGVSNSLLYTIDMTTGLATLVGNSGPGLLINLAINNAGQAYSTDIVSDFLGSVNLATGVFTPIGAVGYNLSFAQDMEFDRDSDELIIAGYDASGWLGWVDVATGSILKIGAFEGGAEVTGFAVPYSSGYNISGVMTYATPVPQAMVGDQATLTGFSPVITGPGGTYLFTNVPDGTYTLSGATTKPRGGTDITDVVRTRQSMSGLWTFTPLQALASDVSGGGITITDVVLMRQKMSGIATPGWIAPNFIFEVKTVVVNGANVIVDIQCLCSGDPSPSYTLP